jgi:hypothetical protein
MTLNHKSLCKEFAELEEQVVKDVYYGADKDCEKARTVLCEMTGRKRIKADNVALDSGFKLEELTGDLFKSPVSASLGHCGEFRQEENSETCIFLLTFVLLFSSYFCSQSEIFYILLIISFLSERRSRYGKRNRRLV